MGTLSSYIRVRKIRIEALVYYSASYFGNNIPSKGFDYLNQYAWLQQPESNSTTRPQIVQILHAEPPHGHQLKIPKSHAGTH